MTYHVWFDFIIRVMDLSFPLFDSAFFYVPLGFFFAVGVYNFLRFACKVD